MSNQSAMKAVYHFQHVSWDQLFLNISKYFKNLKPITEHNRHFSEIVPAELNHFHDPYKLSDSSIRKLTELL